MAGDGIRAYVGGTPGDNDIRALADVDGTIINASGGNDTLRGGRYNDVLSGGAGDDLLWGGDGADQFRFFGDQIDGTDRDKVLDLDFGEGDTLVFGVYGDNAFKDAEGVNAFSNDSAAIVSSWTGVQNLVAQSDWVASQKGKTDTLILTYDFGDGRVQIIEIANGWTAFSAVPA